MWSIAISEKTWPIRGEFRLSRGSRTEVNTLQMELSGHSHVGRAECVPYARYGESLKSVREQIESIKSAIEMHADREALQAMLPAGAARNLLDLALWDWQAKALSEPVWRRAHLPEPKPVLTAFTLSLDTPERMADAARKVPQYPLLKLKLGVSDDAARLRTIKAARPDAKFIVDANEGWTIETLNELASLMAECGVVLCEQPLPAGKDAALAGRSFPFLICADESMHIAEDIAALSDRYQAVNIKLDKTGGLTEALQAVQRAREEELQIMVGCMLASSLALAPAVLLAGIADWVDLDGPLLLAADYQPGLDYAGAQLAPPSRLLWG